MGRKSRAKAQRRHEAERLKAVRAAEASQTPKAPQASEPAAAPEASQSSHAGKGPQRSRPAQRPAVPQAMPDVEPILHEGLPVLEASDEYLMDMLLADGKLASLIVARLSPTTALALPENVDRLSAALAKAGHPHRLVEQDHVPPPQEKPVEAQVSEPEAQASGSKPARQAPKPPEPPRPKPVPLALDL